MTFVLKDFFVYFILLSKTLLSVCLLCVPSFLSSISPLSSPSASPIFSRNTLPRKQDSGPHCGRNTLPKKGLRYGPSPQLRGHEEARDWLRSHSTSGLQDSASNSPFSPGSSLTSPSGTRFNFGQLASSPTSAAQINLAGLRNNSLTNQDVSFDPCSDNRLRNSCMSLDEKTRTMSRSGSFRDGFEEVHGSSLSLVSSTSSIYSTNEEKSQSEIRKLRRELDASQEKVSALTTQLSANAHLVAAFEQSLGNMTIRLKSLTLTAEQKDSELNELRKTIELLKKQNAVAQAAINGVINTPELTPKGDRTAGSNGSPQQQQQQQQQQNQQPDLRIRRQHSSDSVSSVASATSHSSVGSNMDADSKNKKKNKKNWELRQYLSGLAEQCSGVPGAESPLVVILDNLHHVSSLGEIFNGLFNCNYQHSPYIIGTMSQATSSAPNLQLHHNFRWVLCANHMEPVKGFLGRYLRRKLIETEIGSRTRNVELVKIIDWIPRVWHHLNRFLETHSSSDVTIGPRLFLSCPMDVEGSRVWFTDLWNYSIIPYMLEAVREGLQLYGRRAAWEDPAAWVIDTYPWSATPTPADWPPLLQLRPEDVGFDGYSAPREGVRKEPPQSDSDADPLMNMLMRLKEAATSSSPQSYDSDSNSNSHQDDILDSSLESTL
ncbi:neuron navigator 2 isoform X2 [Lates japonicus]|uniref:Neuron navigator 2 isoform X2 n=1 Tax=Lates japonicus TaxID=270547 RepID=A0AAD3R543_LATJO|nr:neuron navigator 2 isoform X2 [Lates japonicus]